MMIRKPHPFAAVIISTGIWFTSAAYASPITGILNFVQSFLPDLGTLAIIGVALVLFSKQVHWAFIVSICAAIWIATNADQVAAMIRGG